MAKDKQQNNQTGGQSLGRNSKKEQAQEKVPSIDVSSGSVTDGASDSELDIHALLRKYMPDYEKEEESDSLLMQSNQAVPGDMPVNEEEARILSSLDAAFSSALAEEGEDSAFVLDFQAPAEADEGEIRVSHRNVGRNTLDEGDAFTFTDDVPVLQEDIGELEDEEGIYENDDDSLAHPFAEDDSRSSSRRDIKSFFSFGKKKKAVQDTFEEDTYEAPLETSSEEAYDDSSAAGSELPDALLSLMFAEDNEQQPGEDEADSYTETEETAEDAGFSEQDGVYTEEEFDPTDINLMVAFGMDADSDRKAGRKTARELGDKLEKVATIREGKKVKLEKPEFVDRSQAPAIKKSIQTKLFKLWIKLGICGLFSVLLLVFENIEVLAKLFTGTAKQFGGVLDPAVYPVVYAMVSLQLMLFACLCAYKQIIRGVRYLFRGVPKPESMTAVMVFVAILYTAIISRITVQSDEPVMFNFVVAATAFMTLLAEIYNTKRELMCFQVVSSDKAKHIVCRISEEESQCEADAFAEEEDICDVMKIEKTDFVDGFYSRMGMPDNATNVFLSCAMGVMAAAAILFGILASIRGDSGVEIARVVCVTLMTLAPVSVYIFLSHPFYRANLIASEYESAIVGETSLEEYSNASIVTFDDKNVFPSYSVKVQNIRIYNNARIDRVLYYASSVFAHAGGPLQDVFEVATLEMGHSDDVQIFDTENGFLAAQVDGVNVIFGNSQVLASKGLYIPRNALDDDIDMTDELSIMYMFREDKLVAKMYIQYVMDGDIEVILSQFQSSGLYVCVRTFDPNIDERMIARKVRMKRIPLKVVRYVSMDEVGAYEEKVDSGLVTCGSPKNLLQIISYCDKVLHTKRTNFALAILSILVGAAVMLLLVLSGSIGIVNSLFVILYHGLWLLPAMATSKVFIR